MSDTADLAARVEKGRAWLAAHDADPPGRFYVWWVMRLHPDGTWRQQPPEVVERYRTWHRGFEAWLRLYCELDGSDVAELKRHLYENGRAPHLQAELAEPGSSRPVTPPLSAPT